MDAGQNFWTSKERVNCKMKSTIICTCLLILLGRAGSSCIMKNRQFLEQPSNRQLLKKNCASWSQFSAIFISFFIRMNYLPLVRLLWAQNSLACLLFDLFYAELSAQDTEKFVYKYVTVFIYIYIYIYIKSSHLRLCLHVSHQPIYTHERIYNNLLTLRYKSTTTVITLCNAEKIKQGLKLMCVCPCIVAYAQRRKTNQISLNALLHL